MSSYLQPGTRGTLGTEWEVQNSRRNQVSRYYGLSGSEKMDLQSFVELNGADEDIVLEQFDFNVLGFDKEADGQLLDWQKSAWSSDAPDDVLFQSAGHGYYTNIDMEKGTYVVYDEQSFTEELGMDWSGGKPYDILDITNNQINFNDFIFSGTSDGHQDELSVNMNDFQDTRWGVNSYNITEVDTKLALADEDKTKRESTQAHDSLKLMMTEADKWLTPKMKEELAQYVPDSKEYNRKLAEFAFQTFDNEGYLQGNEIKSPADKEDPNLDYSANGQFAVKRMDDGQVIVGVKNADKSGVDGLGEITGDAHLSMGKTEGDSNETVVQVGQTDKDSHLSVRVNSKANNQEYYGENIDANYNTSSAKTYRVDWDVRNGNLDSSRSNNSMLVETSENAENNNFHFGTASAKNYVDGMAFDNMYVDNGKNNTVTSTASSGNYFQTSSTSENANIYGGNRSNYFIIDGSDGTYVGGKSDDTFLTGFNARQNFLAGRDGNDFLSDYGNRTFFSAGKGNDTARLAGNNAFAQMGADEDFSASILGSNNQVWSANEYTREKTAATGDSEQLYYNYKTELDNYMMKNNLSFSVMMDKLSNNPDAVIKEIMDSIKNNK